MLEGAESAQKKPKGSGRMAAELMGEGDMIMAIRDAPPAGGIDWNRGRLDNVADLQEEGRWRQQAVTGEGWRIEYLQRGREIHSEWLEVREGAGGRGRYLVAARDFEAGECIVVQSVVGIKKTGFWPRDVVS